MTHPDHDRFVLSDDPPDDALRALVARAESLPTLRPSHDLWPGIAARLDTQHDTQFDARPASRADDGNPPPLAPVTSGARVLPFHVHRTKRPARIPRLAAAAIALVTLSSGATYLVMRHAVVPPVRVASQPNPAATSSAPEPSTTPASARPTAPRAAPLAEPNTNRADFDEPRSASRSHPALRTVARAIDVAVPGAADYDREIADLRTVVGERRGELDSATVAVLTRNLRIIDAAIAASRAALARDPRSPFLGEQLTRSLGQKVELLRTAALLPHA